MKGFTSLEQSEKLKGILPPESADMAYDWFIVGEKYSTIPQCRKFIDDELPCWSLAALMNLLPSELTERGEYSETTYRIDIRKYALTDDVDIYQIAYGNYHWHEDGSCSWSDMINSGEKEELIDAVFQMICWLKENNKL